MSKLAKWFTFALSILITTFTLKAQTYRTLKALSQIEISGPCGDQILRLYYKVYDCSGTSCDWEHGQETIVLPNFVLRGSCTSPYYNCSCDYIPAGAVNGNIEGHDDIDYPTGAHLIWWTARHVGTRY